MKREEKDRWLIIAHCFNMDGRAASHTITDRMPYLLEKGVTPVVLSAPTGTKDDRFPHFRILSFAPSGMLFELRQVIKAKTKRIFSEKLFKTILTILIFPFYIIEKIFVHLDSHWSWFIGATIKGSYLIKEYQPKVIYTTAGPSSTHVTGYFLKKYLRIPWLAELHDPLLFDNDPIRNQRSKFQRWLERKIFQHADAIIYFTDKAMNSAKRRNPERVNVNMLRPGAPPEDYSNINYQGSDKIHFGHFGGLGKGRDLSVFIMALHGLLNEEPSWRDMIRLDIYGTRLDPDSQKALNEYPLNGMIHVHGRLEYDPVTGKSGRRRVLEAMKKCDILLVVYGTSVTCDEYVPSKVFEYLLTSRPILGLGLPGSELETILSQNNHVFVNGEDIIEVKKGIINMVKQWESGGLPDKPARYFFTVEKYVNNLLDIVADIASKKPIINRFPNEL